MDEHERIGVLGRGPERLEPAIAEVGPIDARSHLDPGDAGAAHQLGELGGGELGRLERDGAEHRHLLGPALMQAHERVVVEPAALEPVVGVGVVEHQRHPWRQQRSLALAARERVEDRVELDELMDRRADRTAVELDDLTFIVPPHRRPPGLGRSRLPQQLRHYHVHVDVDRAGRRQLRVKGADTCSSRPSPPPSSSSASKPKSASMTTAALRPGPPVTEPPGWVVPPVW